MTPEDDKQNWMRLYAGLAMVALVRQGYPNEVTAKIAFDVATQLVSEERFNDKG